MNWKKVLLIAFALVLSMGLVACNGETAEEIVDDAIADVTGDPLRIVVVSSPSGVDDGSFNQNVYEGAQAFRALNENATLNSIVEPDMDNAVAAVEQIVGNYDVVLLPGFQFAPITEVAQNNPDTFFVLVDAFPANPDFDEDDPDSPRNVDLPNVYAMQFAEQESGFFAGIAAALETETGKVAFVGGGAIPPVINYHLGFESGVNFANANLDTDAEIVNLSAFAGSDDLDGNYVGTFNDPATGKQIGDALIAEGADIIFVAAGGSGNGVFTAAKEADGVLVIGCDVDQWHLGEDGDRNIVLTSVLKVMDINVTRQLELIADGNFVGGNNVLQADTGSTGFVSADGRQQLDADTIAAMYDALAAVEAGDIEPAWTFSEFGSDDFPGL
ncbi:MAG: BMP family ABC transporter substrate-binding protein [Coriobacteriia bacterium]|nr:BMP family ABC transporter substrate-binding protein [Coriobacteriia bacterium]